MSTSHPARSKPTENSNSAAKYPVDVLSDSDYYRIKSIVSQISSENNPNQSSTSPQSQAGKSECKKSKESVIGHKAAQFALIAEVHKYPLLWDKQDPHSDDKKLKDEAWSRIGKSVGESATICEQRWAAIKKKKRREENLFRTGMRPSVSSATSNFLQSLEFLNPKGTVRRRNNEDHGNPSSKRHRSGSCGTGDQIRRNTASSCPKMNTQSLFNDIAKAFESHSFETGIWMTTEFYKTILKASSKNAPS